MTSGKKALITVGTTEFEDLIKVTSTDSFIQMLTSAGYDDITYQIGNGKLIPSSPYKYFRLDPHITQRYKQADLIICHGGSGTLLQNLSMQKKIVAVVNNSLANNHQQEIVNKLNKQKYILGFNSTEDAAKNLDTIRNFITDNASNRRFCHVESCILNDLVFGRKKQ